MGDLNPHKAAKALQTEMDPKSINSEVLKVILMTSYLVNDDKTLYMF